MKSIHFSISFSAVLTATSSLLGFCGRSRGDLGSSNRFSRIVTGAVAVGNSSNSNADVASSLTIQNGGTVTAAGTLFVADQVNSTGHVLVDGDGSLLQIGARIAMGDNGAGTMIVQGGGDVVVQAGGFFEVSAFGGGSGSMTVTDPGSTVTIGDYLSVGDEGTADGDLTIDNGAQVSTTAGKVFIARTGASSQGLIVVQDLDESDGSTLTSGNDLIVGGNALASGGTGQLDVNTGGTVDVTGSLSVWYNGTVNLDGGTIKTNDLQLANAVSAPFPTVNWTTGTFRFKGDRNVNVETLDDLLGMAPTLVAGQELQVANVATLSAPLRLNGGTLTVGSVLNNNFSNVSFDAGTFNLASANLTVGAGGLFGSSLLIESDQAINVTNQATINAGAELVVAGGFSSGELTNEGELVAIDTTISGPVVNNNNVTVVGTVDFDGLVSGPGPFFGPGTANFNGGMAPGASAAEVSFEGSVSLADTNTLFIEIGGPTLGDDYDSLTIAGDAALDGILDVSLVGFTPTSNQQFTVLTAANIFDNGLVLGGSAASSFSLTVDSTSVILTALAPGVPGDYNNNGTVDAADYVVWRKNPGGFPADAYTTWRSNYGRPPGSGSGSAAGIQAAVPEPASAWLLIIGAVVATWRGRRIASHVPSSR
jgi:T5SS/PEP-CTERM-associated repeat protein